MGCFGCLTPKDSNDCSLITYLANIYKGQFLVTASCILIRLYYIFQISLLCSLLHDCITLLYPVLCRPLRPCSMLHLLHKAQGVRVQEANKVQAVSKALVVKVLVASKAQAVKGMCIWGVYPLQRGVLPSTLQVTTIHHCSYISSFSITNVINVIRTFRTLL